MVFKHIIFALPQRTSDVRRLGNYMQFSFRQSPWTLSVHCLYFRFRYVCLFRSHFSRVNCRVNFVKAQPVLTFYRKFQISARRTIWEQEEPHSSRHNKVTRSQFTLSSISRGIAECAVRHRVKNSEGRGAQSFWEAVTSAALDIFSYYCAQPTGRQRRPPRREWTSRGSRCRRASPGRT